MKIKKGRRLKIQHNRKGEILVVARKDFDTGDAFYPVNATRRMVGRGEIMEPGDRVPCRAKFCNIVEIL